MSPRQDLAISIAGLAISVAVTAHASSLGWALLDLAMVIYWSFQVANSIEMMTDRRAGTR